MATKLSSSFSFDCSHIKSYVCFCICYRIPSVVEVYNKLKASVKDQSLPAVKDEPTDGGCTSSRCVKDEPSDTEEQGEDHLMKNADVGGS